MTDSSNLNKPLGISEFGQLNERGKSVIANIRDLQTTEEGLFKQLQTGSSTRQLNQEQQQELVKQIKNVSDSRYNLYLELQQNQVYYQDNVNVSHNILTQETDALEVVERELNRAEKRIGLIGEQRNAIRTIDAIEKNPKYQKFGDALGNYKKKIEKELEENCTKVVQIVENDCMKLASEDETKAFFYKMIGDYYRYACES